MTGTLGAVQNTVAYSYGNANWKDLLTAYDGQSISSCGARLRLRRKPALPIADRCANPCSLSPPPAALACVAYDAIGNPLTYRDGMSMTWSGRNLTELTKDGQSISYTYDANGQRASKTVDGNTTTRCV